MEENPHKWILEIYQRSRTTSKRSNHNCQVEEARKTGKDELEPVRMDWNLHWFLPGSQGSTLMMEVICRRGESFVTDSRVAEIGREDLAGVEGLDLTATQHLQDVLVEEVTECTTCNTASCPALAFLVWKSRTSASLPPTESQAECLCGPCYLGTLRGRKWKCSTSLAKLTK